MRKERSLSGLILTFLLISFGVASCDRAQNCEPTTRDYMILQFVDSAGMVSEDTFTVTSYSSTKIITDTISSTFNLSLDPFHDTITYKFEKPGFSNWITVSYQNVVNVISEDCGPEFQFFQLEVLDTSFDSVRIADHRLLDGINVNIKVLHE